MNFLTPLFLLGALAIAGPVIFHLIRRTSRERTVFSSLMFLLPTPPRLTRRSRLENWLLLLLRCLALALLAFGFARPFFKQSSLNETSGPPAKRVVVLLDVSASMRRANLWADARTRLDAVLRNLSPGDQLAVFTYDRGVQPLLSFGEWNATPAADRMAMVSSRVAAIEPGWSGTNLAAALIAASEALADEEGQKTTGPRQIMLISDLQAGSKVDALQGYEWPKGVELIVEPLKAKNPTNAGLQLLADAADADRQSAASVRVRVTNAPDATREQFKVGWTKTAGGEFVGPLVDAYVPPGQSRVVTLPVAGAAGANAIALRGDDEDFDNTVYVIPPAQQKIAVAYFGSEKADDSKQPLFFLKRALPETPRLAVSIVPVASGGVASPEVANASLAIVTDVLSTAQAAALREQALAGKTIFVAPKNAAAAAAMGPLFGGAPLAVEEMRPTSYAMLGDINFQHPLFAAFADPRYSDFTKIHFWKYRRLDATKLPDARVLAKFDQGDPALVEVPVGKGRVLVLTSGWNPDDSQFAVSSKFVPLLFSILELSGALSAPPAQSIVGDPLPLPAATASQPTAIRAPGGKTVPAPAGATSFALTNQPGVYRIEGAGHAQEFAVNLDPAETRTAPLAIEDLERLGAPIAHKKTPAVLADSPAHEALLQAGAAEGRQKLWRWFIVATLIVLFTESLIAGWTARKPALAGGTETP
jgi:hypothetical protein